MAPEGESGLIGRSSGRDDAEQPIELRRHLEALRRSRLLIAGLMLVVTGATVVISVLLPESYKASARIVYDASADPLGNQSADVVQRELATIGALITTPSILSRAAAQTGFTERALEGKVSAAVDTNANIIKVTATDGRAEGAQRIADAVTRVFLAARRTQDVQQISNARAKLTEQLARLGATQANRLEAEAIQTRLSELTVSEASAGSELQLAEAAQRPTSPASPRPVRNGIVAFFAAIFLGVLIALGRDQLVPRVSGPRELARITELPVLVSIPFVRRRFGRQPTVLGAAEHEAYQTLQATIRFQLAPTEQRVVLVTSAVEGEGKTTVTANVGRALARAGRKTLIISGDMRHPRLHELFDVPLEPGLSDVLALLEAGGDAKAKQAAKLLTSLLHAQPGTKGNLDVLASGARPSDPGLLIAGATPALLTELRRRAYEYVLIDGTPLLGIADGRTLATRVDDVLLVARLDRLSLEDVVEVRDILDRLDVTPLGYTVIGGRRIGSSYYSVGPAELETV